VEKSGKMKWKNQYKTRKKAMNLFCCVSHLPPVNSPLPLKPIIINNQNEDRNIRKLIHRKMKKPCNTPELFLVLSSKTQYHSYGFGKLISFLSNENKNVLNFY
jgi:hypothetical protein